MGILTMMIMAKLTYLEDKEFVWFMIYSGLLLIFSIPFLVGLHKHTDPSCNCQVRHSSRSSNTEEEEVFGSNDPEAEAKKIEIASKKKKQPEFGLIKKPEMKLQNPSGKNPKASKDESPSTSSAEKTKKTKIAQKNTKKTGSSKPPKSKKIKEKKVSKSSSPSTSSRSEDSDHVEAVTAKGSCAGKDNSELDVKEEN